MTQPPARPTPTTTAITEAARRDRLAREAEALRANLRRRKEQARARVERAPSHPLDAPQGSAGDEPCR